MSDTLSPVIELVKKLTEEEIKSLKAHLQELELSQNINELSASEIRKIELTDFDKICCPRCLSVKTIKWSHYRNRKRFMCKNCERTFNELTGTVWHGIHNHKKFKEFIKCMADKKTLRASASIVGICLQTSFYWRHKLCKAFLKIDKNWLKGEIQADDTFFLESSKGQKDIVTKENRKPRKRGGKASKAGVHDELVCVMAAIDNQGNTLLKVAGKGRLTKKMVQQTLAKQIRKQRVNKTILVTDRHSSFLQIVRQKKLIHQTLAAHYKQFTNIYGYNINKVNAIHSRLKRWLTKFNGVASKFLQNYLNYFRIYDKVNSFKERFNLLLRLSTIDNQLFTKNSDIIATTFL